MSSRRPRAPVLNFTRTIRNCEPRVASSSSQPMLTLPPGVNQRVTNTYEAAITTRNYRKRLQKTIRELDNTNHSQYQEFSCVLCNIIVPDEDTMRKHSHSHMHLTRLLKCYLESVEKTKEIMKTEEDDDVSDSSDSSECSDGLPVKKLRWSLQDNVALI